MKRFQECNWLVKLWRYRWYLLIPFKYFWYTYIKGLVVRETVMDETKGHIVDTNNTWNPKGKELWSILIGEAQGKMRWVWTSQEVFNRLNQIED